MAKERKPRRRGRPKGGQSPVDSRRGLLLRLKTGAPDLDPKLSADLSNELGINIEDIENNHSELEAALYNLTSDQRRAALVDLPKRRGDIPASTVAAKAGVSRQSIYRWRKKPEYNRAREAALGREMGMRLADRMEKADAACDAEEREAAAQAAVNSRLAMWEVLRHIRKHGYIDSPIGSIRKDGAPYSRKELAEAYMAAHPDADEDEAYEATAHMACLRFTDAEAYLKHLNDAGLTLDPNYWRDRQAGRLVDPDDDQ